MSLPIEKIYSELQTHAQEPRWIVAYSGGLDSSVLLHLLATSPHRQARPDLIALHVNHQISHSAMQWQHHCAKNCETLGVEFAASPVSLVDQGLGLEAAARRARYAIFEAALEAGGVLLLGHHQDDQVETFFLRLMRGSGLAGLASIPRHRPLAGGSLLRPLLDLPRADLLDYARHWGLDWIEDDSNSDESLDRNYLRHRVLPLLEARWPAYRERIGTTVAGVKDAGEVLANIDQQLLASAQDIHFGEPTLCWDRAVVIDEKLQCRQIRAWLRGQACAMPDRTLLLEFVRQLREGDADSQPQLQTGLFRVRYFGARLYLSSLAVLERPAPSLRAVRGRGIASTRQGDFRIGYRQGGERCRPQGRAKSQSLKKLLQEYEVPYWLRDQLPLVFNQRDELVAVADLWICEGFQASAGEMGFELVWR